VEIGTKILRKLGKSFGKFLRFLQLLDSATCGEDGEHEATVIDVGVERWGIAADVPKMRSMCLPGGNAITDTSVNGGLAVQVGTVKVNAVPPPISARHGMRLDAT
jgi:hypothetical protein